MTWDVLGWQDPSIILSKIYKLYIYICEKYIYISLFHVGIYPDPSKQPWSLKWNKPKSCQANPASSQTIDWMIYCGYTMLFDISINDINIHENHYISIQFKEVMRKVIKNRIINHLHFKLYRTTNATLLALHVLNTPAAVPLPGSISHRGRPAPNRLETSRRWENPGTVWMHPWKLDWKR